MNACIPFSTTGDLVTATFPALVQVPGAYFDFQVDCWVTGVQLSTGLMLNATAGTVAIAIGIISQTESGFNMGGGGKILAPHIFRSGVATPLSIINSISFGLNAALSVKAGQRLTVLACAPNSSGIKIDGGAFFYYEPK